MADPAPIDWQKLAEQLGAMPSVEPPGLVGMEYGSSDLARAALEALLTPEQLSAAVDHYISHRPGSELARSALWLLHPWSAMRRCREVFDSSSDLDARRSAIELLRVVADRRALPWIPEFLDDPDAEIQAWAIGILDQLAFSKLVYSDECLDILGRARNHPNEHVQRTAMEIAQRFEIQLDDPATEFFLNVDLDIDSSHDLSPLEQALEPRTHLLARPAGRTSFELGEPVSATAPEPLILEFVRLVNELPPAARKVWDQASRRVFDIGIQSGRRPPNQQTYRLAPDTLRAAAEIGAEIAITVYALFPDDEA